MGYGTHTMGLTFDDAMQRMIKWPSTLPGICRSWSLITEEKDGTFSFYERPSQPCYGEMRPYAKITHSNMPQYAEKKLLPVSQRTVTMPFDLYAPFPTSIPKAVSIAIRTDEAPQRYLEQVVYNPEISPWRTVLKDVTLLYKDDSHKKLDGVVIGDTTVDPTVMVNMFRKTNQINSYQIDNVLKHFPDANLLAAFVLGQAMNGSVDKFSINTNIDYANWSGNNQDWSAIMNGKPYDYTDGGTFQQRYAYNRPKNDYIWKDPTDKNNFKLPHEKGGVKEAKENLDFLTNLIK
jgi:hypothetical protein